MSFNGNSVYTYSNVWSLFFCNCTLFIFLKIDFLFHLKWFLKLTRFFNRRSWKFVQIWNQQRRNTIAINSLWMLQIAIWVIELLLTSVSKEFSCLWCFRFGMKVGSFGSGKWFGEIGLLGAGKVVFCKFKYKIGVINDVEHFVMLVGKYLHKLRAHRTAWLLLCWR